MSRDQQQTFAQADGEFKNYWKGSGRKVHGGAYAVGRRKTRRPFSSKKPVHLVLRSSRAKGSLSLKAPRNVAYVRTTMFSLAKLCGVKIYEFSNSGNHLHIALRAENREGFKRYLRATTGMIARHVLGAKKGLVRGKFWDALAFTRIAEWGRAFVALKKYVLKNILESAGIIAHSERKFRLVKGQSTA